MTPKLQINRELLERLRQDKVNIYFQLWAGEHAEKWSQLFDWSSMSTCTKRNPFTKNGNNWDRENLVHINLTLQTSCGSGLPIWYQVHPGSMSDKVILEKVLTIFSDWTHIFFLRCLVCSLTC